MENGSVRVHNIRVKVHSRVRVHGDVRVSGLG